MVKVVGFLLAIAIGGADSAVGAGSPAQPEIVAVRSGTLTLRGLLWRPAGAAPFPAVLFNHGSGPGTDSSRPAALGPAFARHGYVLLYLYRRGAGLSADQGTDSQTLMAAALATKGQKGRNEVQMQLLDSELADVLAGLEFLRRSPEIDAQRVAVAGHSFGGQLTLLAAQRDATIGAAVVFGAAAASWSSSPSLRARLLAAVSRTSAPVLFVHAANDFSVEPGKALAAQMSRLGKPHLLKIYPAIGRDADHGHDFVHLALATWEPDVFAFLDEHMRGEQRRERSTARPF
jgi:carboxymethylenebutenolidase